MAQVSGPATHGLDARLAVRELDQIEVVGETLRYTLNVLATVALEWLRPCLNSDWAKRYGERLNGYRLPKEKHERQALLKVIGQDGYQLLEHLAQATEQPWLTKLPAVKLVRQV